MQHAGSTMHELECSTEEETLTCQHGLGATASAPCRAVCAALTSLDCSQRQHSHAAAAAW